MQDEVEGESRGKTLAFLVPAVELLYSIKFLRNGGWWKEVGDEGSKT